jgi:hypothetical protein
VTYLIHAGIRSTLSPVGNQSEIYMKGEEVHRAAGVIDTAAYLYLGVVRNGRLTVLCGDNNLIDAKVILLHGMSLDAPAIYQSISFENLCLKAKTY